ncbi:hypothetical protein PFISCL1PPCAC_7173, partial [Pristionchus fissidentatus]
FVDMLDLWLGVFASAPEEAWAVETLERFTIERPCALIRTFTVSLSCSILAPSPLCWAPTRIRPSPRRFTTPSDPNVGVM